MANSNRGKGPKAKVPDFIPEWDSRPQTWQEQLATAKHLNAAHGGTTRGAGHGHAD